MKPGRTLTVLAVFSSGCFGLIRGSGDIVTETRDVEGFDRVDVCCGWQVTIEQGDEESLELRGDDNIVKRIDADVRGDELVIDFRRDGLFYDPTRQVEVHLNVIDLEGLTGSGGVEILMPQISTPELRIQLSGGSELFGGTLDTELFDVEVSGGGEVEISGKTDEQLLQLSGGSRHRAGDLRSNTLDAELSGGSQATVWVTDEIDARLSGGSILRYYGVPTVDDQSSGGSRLESLGNKE